jgi:hypothetical protein
MAVLLVTYEHNTAGKDYSQFFATIKSSGEWWHYLDATWLVDTTMTADALAKALYPFFTKEDRLLVVRITADHQGWLQQAAWDWINKRTF